MAAAKAYANTQTEKMMAEESKKKHNLTVAAGCPGTLGVTSSYTMEDPKVTSLKCLSAKCVQKKWGRCKKWKDMKIEAKATGKTATLWNEAPKPACVGPKSKVDMTHKFTGLDSTTLVMMDLTDGGEASNVRLLTFAYSKKSENLQCSSAAKAAGVCRDLVPEMAKQAFGVEKVIN